MALDPFKVAPRTMFESEVVKAEKKYRYWLKIVMQKLKTVILGVYDYNELAQAISKFTATKAFNNLCCEAARSGGTQDGGTGSGNWGHKGRPGMRGGSGKGGHGEGKNNAQYYSRERRRYSLNNSNAGKSSL